MSLISVIIPCYNAAPYIDKALTVLENQSQKDFDVIIVDDNSNDNTSELIQSKYIGHVSYNITFLRNEKNLGPSASRLKAASISNSLYLAFCDADDWFEPNYIDVIKENIKTSEPDLIIMGYKRVLSNGKVYNSLYSPKDELNIGVQKALAVGVNSLCVLTIKKSLFTSVQHIDLRHGEDMALIPLIIAKSIKINIIHKPLYNYYCRKGSVSHNVGQDVIDSLIKSSQHVQRNIPDDCVKYMDFWATKTILYGILLNLFKFSYDKQQANDIINDVEKQYPLWYQNEHICQLNMFKRMFLHFVHKRNFFCLRIMSILHKIIIEI